MLRPPFSKVFFSETTRPIKAILHVEPLWEGETKVGINGAGHINTMAATPIEGKNLLKNLLLHNPKAGDLVVYRNQTFKVTKYKISKGLGVWLIFLVNLRKVIMRFNLNVMGLSSPLL